MNSNSPIPLTVTALSTHAEGIGRVEGKAVFVPFVLPGETWEVEIIEKNKSYDRAVPVKRIEDSPEHPARVKAPCPYFGICGGCQMQHIEYSEQLRFKQQWLEETFRRIAHIDVESQPVIHAEAWEYRNKVTIPLIEQNGRVETAFHEIYHPARYVSIADCPISHPRIRKAIPLLVEALRGAQPGLLRHSKDETQGSRAVFRMIEGHLSIQLHDVIFAPEAERRLVEHVIHQARIADELYLFTGQDPRQFTLPGEPIPAWNDSFLQVNDAVRNLLYDHVLSLPYSLQQSVLDGYCGVGILTRRLTEKFAKVAGVEINPSAAADAQERTNREGLADRVRIHAQSLEAYLRGQRERFDALVLNPPRAGLSPKVRQESIRLRPVDVVIISCHPAALARDTAEFLKAGYSIQNLQPFDMFPQTYHFEVAAWLKRTGA